MAMAMIYPEPGKGGRGKKSEAGNSAGTAGFSARRVQDARTILRHSRALAEAVLKGAKPFDVAVAEVREAEQALSGEEAKRGRLRASAPDLAELVIKGPFAGDQLSASSAIRSNCSAISKRILRSASFLISTAILRICSARSRHLLACALPRSITRPPRHHKGFNTPALGGRSPTTPSHRIAVPGRLRPRASRGSPPGGPGR